MTDQGDSPTADRREFLTAAAVAGAAGLALATAGGAIPAARAQDESAAAAVDLLNVGILLEGLLCDAHQQVLDAGVLSERDRELLVPVLAYELDYLQELSVAVRERGGAPASKPSFRFPPEDLGLRAAALSLLSRLEEGVLRTWHGQLVTVRDPDLLRRLRPMIMAKARHAAVVSMLQEDEGVPFPAAVEGTGSLGEFLEEIRTYRVAG